MGAGRRTRAHGSRRYSRADVARRRSRLRRRLLAGGVVVAAGVAAVVLFSGGDGTQRHAAQQFATAWAQRDYGRMYDLLDDDARAQVTSAAFADAYRTAAETATVTSIVVGSAQSEQNGAVPIPVTIHTSVFGTIRSRLLVPIGGGKRDQVAWARQLVFPGLRAGETLTRQTTLPGRATLLARDGSVLAQGPDRTSPDPAIAGEIVGRLGPIPAEQQAELRADGYPDNALVGTSGLERVFQSQLAGTPGGTLYAGTRVLAQTQPRAGAAVRSTIDPKLEQAAITALGGRYGGAVAMQPQTGQILALAGVAYSALQPPGSTFKIITATGVLEAGIAKPTTPFPYETQTEIEGVPLQNANGESCGGTLVQAFANSCNSVYAPLGARLGGQKLVNVAQRFGFNQPTGIPGAAESTIPPASSIGDDLAVGSSAIGQGEVQATTLEMTLAAVTIGDGGRRPQPTLEMGVAPRFTRVTTPHVAHQVRDMMRAVVEYGTGTAAGIDGADVAGKTGTAELRDTVRPDSTDNSDDDGTDSTDSADDAASNPALNTDAWFVSFAPEDKPRIAVGILFPEDGAGGDTAAPAARGVLAAALQH